MSIPSPYALVLLLGAALRIYRLIAEDTILDRPRAWVLRLPHGWKDGDTVPARYRSKIDVFITCPWCAGFWITLAWWAGWQLWPHATLVAAAPLAISMAVGLTIKNLDK